MTAIATLLVVLTISLLTVRVATVMLVLTGLSLPLARFQARSAFTGCGYTTTESEQIVTHPVRRRIIGTLMLLGNVGIVTTFGTLMAGLLAGGGTEQVIEAVPDPDTGRDSLRILEVQTGYPLWARLALLAGGVAMLWAVAASKVVERYVNRWTFKLLRRYTNLEVRDYANLMHLGGEYGINELRIKQGDWLADKPLKELRLTSEGMVALGISRADGSYVGAPHADTVPHVGDTMIVYGRTDRLAELDTRRADPRGVLRHVEAIADQKVRDADAKLAEAVGDEERAEAERLKREAEERRDAVHDHAETVDEDDNEAADQAQAGTPVTAA